MDVQERRLVNLHALLNQRFEGTIARLAEAIGKDPNQTRFILYPDRPGGRKIGEKLARQIEIRLDLSPLWLDSEHDGHQTVVLTSGQMHLREAVAQYLVNIPDEVAQSIASLIESSAKRS